MSGSGVPIAGDDGDGDVEDEDEGEDEGEYDEEEVDCGMAMVACACVLSIRPNALKPFRHVGVDAAATVRRTVDSISQICWFGVWGYI